MSNKITSLYSTFSVNGELTDDDTRFLSVTIDVMHDGVNLNRSSFTKDVVNECIDSIKNTPVLGFIKYDASTNENDFKGHEYILTKTKNGIEEKYIGSAYGVIPESCNPRWFAKMCDDGVERDFLQVDALLWTKFDDSTDIIDRDSEKAQSMELQIDSIEGEEDEDGIFNFSKFKFDGCCILGDDVQPAMTGANVKVKDSQFAMNDFIESIQDDLGEKFSIFTKLVKDKDGQGGVRDMPKGNTDFAQTVLSQFEDIANIVSQYETCENFWGDQVPRFYLVDIQDDEAIATDMKNNWQYYGFPFSINGDKPEIDFSNGGKRKKVVYEDYEEGAEEPTGAFDFGEYISSVESETSAKVVEFESKITEIEDEKSKVTADYEQIKSEYDEIKPKYDEYVQAEQKREADELNAQKDAAFAEFESDLSENADFAAIKERKDEMSVDDIMKECALLHFKAIRGKNSFSNSNASSAAVDVIEDDDSKDGYVHTKYGYIKPVR